MAAAEGPRKRMPSAVAASAVGSSGFSDAWPLAGETMCPGQNRLGLFQLFLPALKLSPLEFPCPLQVPCEVQPQGPELKLLRKGHRASKSFLLGFPLWSSWRTSQATRHRRRRARRPAR